MSWLLKNNYLLTIFKENPNQKHCTEQQEHHDRNGSPIHLNVIYANKCLPQNHLHAKSSWQAAASSASAWISAVQPALVLGWGWCCSFRVASSLSALLVETALQMILWFREGFNGLLVLMSCVASVSFCTGEGPALSLYCPSQGLASVHCHCSCDWEHSSGPWCSWVR